MPLVVEYPCVYVPIAGVYVVGVAFLKDRFTFSSEFEAGLEELFQLCWRNSGELPRWVLRFRRSESGLSISSRVRYGCVRVRGLRALALPMPLYQLLHKEQKL